MERTGPDQIHALFYGMDRTNECIVRMWQVHCHVCMEVLPSLTCDGTA